MSPPKAQPLCRYHYDPLDRLASCFPLEQAHTRCFYRLNRLTTEIQGQIKTSMLQAEHQLLAQWQQDTGKHECVLIATDTPGSVIHALTASRPEAFAYMPYGTRSPSRAPLQLPGFNGERLDPVTGHYLLGNGYRAFNPLLMKFNSPDSLSPFGEGGLNTYAYCAGDPVNRVDPQGHAGWFRQLKMALGLGTRRSKNINLTRITQHPFDDPLTEPNTFIDSQFFPERLKNRSFISGTSRSRSSKTDSIGIDLSKPNYQGTTPINESTSFQNTKKWVDALPANNLTSSISFTTSTSPVASRKYSDRSVSSLNSARQLNLSLSTTSGSGIFHILPDEAAGIAPRQVSKNRAPLIAQSIREAP